MEYAEGFKSKPLDYHRIREVSINSEISHFKDSYQEFVFNINNEQLIAANISPIQLFSFLNTLLGKDIYIGQIQGEEISLQSKQSKEYDLWNILHQQFNVGAKAYKLSELANVQKNQGPQRIVKENQQYQIYIQYEYLGSQIQGQKILEGLIEKYQQELPLGYSIKNIENYGYWGKESSKQYGLLLLVFIIIYFSSGILFNSLRQPLAIIFVIPISFIGIFLTFSLFNLNFDQGGFASFVLLCGISVNANIYILNQYNNICIAKPHISKLRAYIKAWNIKITPIFLTVVSTVLGFIPFMVGEHKEAFWFPLAAGTIGGLTMSLLGTFLFLPLFTGIGKKKVNP